MPTPKAGTVHTDGPRFVHAATTKSWTVADVVVGLPGSFEADLLDRARTAPNVLE
jgi:hypothetical protein